jgi:signal transduction histidine kinase/DNA-binding response OmpR family regulator
VRRQQSFWTAVTWARLLAGAAAAAGLWVAIGPMALHGAASLALLAAGPAATGAALILCAAGVVGLSRGRQAGARFSGLLVLLLTIVGTLIHAPAIVATPPGLLLWDLVTRHGWIDNASSQVLMVCGVGLFIPLRSGSPRLRDASSAFVAAVLLAGGLARLSGFIGGGLAWDPFAGMPAPVAAGAIALGGALLFVRRGVALLGAPVAGWRQIPFTVTITLAALSCVLWRSLSMERSRTALPMEHRDVVAIAADVNRAVQTHANVLKRLVYRPVTNTTDWARSALAQSSTMPAYAAIAWVTPALETRVVASSDPGRHEAIDLKGLAVGKTLVKQARTTNAVVVSRPVAVDVDGDGFLILVPTPPAASSEGVAVGLVLYHDLFASIPSVRRAGVEIADGQSALYRAGPERPAGGPLAWTPIGIPGASEWRLRAWRGGSRLVPSDSALPEIVLGVGLLLAVVAGVGAHFLDEGGRRTKAARRVNNDLRKEIERRRQMERQLAAARDAALEAAKAKSAFLATVSHEIRTPMNGVIGTVSLLLETPLASEQREYAEQIQRSADSLVTIINDILDFSKIEAGKLTLEAVDFDPREALHDAIDVVAPSAQAKGLELVCDVPADLPGQIRLDPSRWRQMLLNLLGNAVKFTATGSVRATLAIEPSAEGEPLLRVTVADTGIGIKREALARLFEPFSQADGSMTRRYGGTGLGLAITRQLAELMGGKVGVESAEGGGSAFWFTTRFRSAAGSPFVATPLEGLRLLIADDHPFALAALDRELTALGAIVETTGSAEELFKRAGQPQGAHLLLIDESLPLRGGSVALNAARRLASLPPLPAVLLTSRTRAEGLSSAERLGFATCLVKPQRRHQLAQALIATMEALAAGRTEVPPPSMQAARTRVVPPASPVPGERAPRPAGGLRVLVAEDNEVNQKVVSRMLERLGHHAEVAVNGREALERARTGTFDLVLMDCQMPEMDGWEATARIRAALAGRRRIPILALTANASDADRQRCLDAGMDEHLSKPLKLERLAEALATWGPGPAESKRPA